MSETHPDHFLVEWTRSCIRAEKAKAQDHDTQLKQFQANNTSQWVHPAKREGEYCPGRMLQTLAHLEFIQPGDMDLRAQLADIRNPSLDPEVANAIFRLLRPDETSESDSSAAGSDIKESVSPSMSNSSLQTSDVNENLSSSSSNSSLEDDDSTRSFHAT